MYIQWLKSWSVYIQCPKALNVYVIKYVMLIFSSIIISSYINFNKKIDIKRVFNIKINKHKCNDINLFYFIALFMISEKFLNDASTD